MYPRFAVTAFTAAVLCACHGTSGHDDISIVDGGSLDAALPFTPSADAHSDSATLVMPTDAVTAAETGPSPALGDGPVDAAVTRELNYCGDGAREPLTEECDDGLPGAGLCTETCIVESNPLSLGPIVGSRSLGRGPHVVGGGDRRFGLVFQEDPAPTVWFQWFDLGGRPLGPSLNAGQAAKPTASANPVLASLPGGQAVLAWSDASDVSPDIVLAEVSPSGALTRTLIANEVKMGSQEEPDLLWTGRNLVVAWTDLGDVRYRYFTEALAAASEELTLAATAALEGGVVLSAFADGWAAAWRVGEGADENLAVAAGDTRWNTIPPESPAPAGDRPALVELTPDKLLLLFSVPVSQSNGGALFRLRAAILDRTVPGPTATASWSALDLTTFDGDGVQRRPAAVRVGDEVIIAWEETSVTGRRKVVLQTVRWNAPAASIDVTREVTLMRATESHADEQQLALGSMQSAFVAAWEHENSVWTHLRPLPWTDLSP